MDNYYIKNVWGPGAQEGYPFNNEMHFAENQRSASERFSQCDGFLIYETGHWKGCKKGAKSVYAKGVISSSEVLFNQYADRVGADIGVEERKFPYIVKIKLTTRVNPEKGVPLDKIREVIGRPKETMQRQGGLIRLTEEQFNELSLELDKIK
jgi:hypothetical protein